MYVFHYETNGNVVIEFIVLRKDWVSGLNKASLKNGQGKKTQHLIL